MNEDLESLMAERVDAIRKIGITDEITLWCNWYDAFNKGNGGLAWTLMTTLRGRKVHVSATTWERLLSKLETDLKNGDLNEILLAL